MNWVRESWAAAKREPVPALAFCFGILTVLLVVVSSWFAYMAVQRVKQEAEARIQLACEMSFANGKALLDTVADDVDPKVVENYRRNLELRANEAIHKFDPDFECKIPEETEEAP